MPHMRIDAYNQIAQVYKTTSAAKLQKTENARHGRDEVQISSFGRDYQIARIQEELDILQEIIKNKDSERMKEYLTKIRKNIE